MAGTRSKTKLLTKAVPTAANILKTKQRATKDVPSASTPRTGTITKYLNKSCPKEPQSNSEGNLTSALERIGQLTAQRDALIDKIQSLESKLACLEEEVVLLKRKDIISKTKQAVRQPNAPVLSKKAPSSSVFQKEVVRIVGDSQTRQMSSLLREILPARFLVEGKTMPGAGALHVLETAKQDSRHRKIDHLILLCGTNDVHSRRPIDMHPALKDLERNTNIGRIIFLAIPHRFDLHPRSAVHKVTRKLNESIYDFCLSSQKSDFIDLNLNHHHHTRHGLHINLKGKERLCKHLKTRLMKATSSPPLAAPIPGLCSSLDCSGAVDDTLITVDFTLGYSRCDSPSFLAENEAAGVAS